MSTPFESEKQSVRGSTGGQQLGSVPLIAYLDALQKGDHDERAAIVKEHETWRSLHEAERDEWRVAHHRVHDVERMAIDTSTVRMNERLESMNEFRRQIDSMLGMYITRDLLDQTIKSTETAVLRVDKEYSRRFDELNVTVVEMNRQWANAQGRVTAYGAALGLFIVVLNFAVGIVLFILN